MYRNRNLLGGLAVATLSVALLTAAPASAAVTVLTFEGNICGGLACVSENPIDASYGDGTGVDVQYRSAENATGVTVEPFLRFWSTNYGDLVGVAYANPPGSVFGEIVLQAATGYEIALVGYDIATYLGRVSTVPVAIESLGGASISIGVVATNWPTHASFSVNSDYFTDGIRLRFGPDSWNTGIDNITFDVRAISHDVGVVPEPSAWAMMLLGFFGLGSALRSRRHLALLASL